MALSHFAANHFAAFHFLAVWRDVPLLDITDTDILQKPVNCVLHGDQVIRDRYRINDVRANNRRENVTVTRSGARKLGGGTGFTVRTDHRGYD